MSIYIFSRPIHSGKTTELLQFCGLQKNIHGILMPDLYGSRKAFNIASKEVFDIQCTDVTNTIELLIAVGKFHFYAAAFDKANSILQHALTKNPDWLIIDEIGKLELAGEGFYSSIIEALKVYNNKNKAENLLITVRDSLLEQVITFFKIENFKVVNSLDAIK